jgi:geranylgeranyl reductase family protein
MNDVVIVGGGPGGSSAAIGLQQQGVRDVLLLDRAHFPREKTCGSGLSPSAIELAEILGVSEELHRRAVALTSVKIVTPQGHAMVIASNAAAVVLLRSEFDDMLHRRALALGTKFEGGVRATELIREGGRVVGVRLADGSERRAKVVLCADGAHSIFSIDRRPKRTISTLMGWWEGAEFVPGQAEMIFDKNLMPLYGWLFPETTTRVNIGICMDGQGTDGGKTERNVRDVFAQFVKDHYEARLEGATQIGKLKGHPISYTTWVDACAVPGALYVGEAARVTHNATGEGISQAMQSGLFAAEMVSEVLSGKRTEQEAWRAYTWKHRKRFTAGFIGGHALRVAVRTRVLDGVATVYNQPLVRKGVVRLLGSALAGSSVKDATATA